jgi:succinate-acetate transporter protein
LINIQQKKGGNIMGKAAEITLENVQSKALVAETVIKDNTANPAPLGLMGFGLTTILLKRI